MKTWILYLAIFLVTFGTIGVMGYNDLNARLNAAVEIIKIKNTEYDKLFLFAKEQSNEIRRLQDALLVSETEKAAALQKIANLEWQLKDATKESMRVEGQLTERLAEVKAENEALQKNLSEEAVFRATVIENMKILEKNLVRETAVNKVLSLNLSETQKNLASAINWVVGLEINKKNLEYDLAISTRDKSVLNERLEVAKRLVEGALYQASGKPVSVAGKTVRPVILIPADVKISVANFDKIKAAIDRTMAINQLWFFSQTGMTFSPKELTMFRGKKSTAEYGRLSPGDRMIEIRKEINASRGEVFIFFAYLDNNDLFNWGDSITLTILIGDQVIELIANGQSSGWGVVAHELGHVWGLPHLVSNDKAAIMRVAANGYSEAADFFPLANFTEQEKNIVRRNMAK